MTVALNTAKGTNLLSNVKSSASPDVPNNYLEVSGCPSFSEDTTANKVSTLTFGKIVNKGYVADTSQFKFQLYAVDMNGISQKIAEISQSSMIIDADTSDDTYSKSMLTPGSYSSFSVVSVSSSYVA